MRLLVVLAVVVFINLTESQKSRRKNNTQKRKKDRKLQKQQQQPSSSSFFNYTGPSDLELGPKSPLAYDVIGWIRQVESQFDKKPEFFSKKKKEEDEVNMIWGRSFGGGRVENRSLERLVKRGSFRSNSFSFQQKS